jgi:Rad3-related DNA helicase
MRTDAYIPLVVAAAFIPMGCAQTEGVLEAGESAAKETVRRLDVTGLSEANQSLKSAGDAAREAVATADVQALNEAVLELRQAIALLVERIEPFRPRDAEAVSADLAATTAALRAQVERARADEAVNAILDLSETLNAAVKSLELHRVNELLAALQTTVADLSAAVERLGTNVDGTLEETEVVLRQARDHLAAVPVDEIRGTVHSLDQTAQAVRRTAEGLPSLTDRAQSVLSATRTALLVVAAAGACWGLCAIAWIARWVRGRG